MSTPALAAAEAAGLIHRVIRHGPVRSLAEAARARGTTPAGVVKTLVVRRGEDDFLFVLVPGDRAISWPKLRALLGVSRLSMPDAEVARKATGYERGTITPFGSATAWPVIADGRMRGQEITLGAGEHGVALAAPADEVLRILDATVADISDPEPGRVTARDHDRGVLHARAGLAGMAERGAERPCRRALGGRLLDADVAGGGHETTGAQEGVGVQRGSGPPAPRADRGWPPGPRGLGFLRVRAGRL